MGKHDWESKSLAVIVTCSLWWPEVQERRCITRVSGAVFRMLFLERCGDTVTRRGEDERDGGSALGEHTSSTCMYRSSSHQLEVFHLKTMQRALYPFTLSTRSHSSPLLEIYFWIQSFKIRCSMCSCWHAHFLTGRMISRDKTQLAPRL